MAWNIFGTNTQNIEIKATTKHTSSSDVVERDNLDFSIFKATIPRFLYKPPFGWPRADNPPLLKQFARNGYILSVVTKIQEAAAWADWKIKPKDGVELTPEHDKKIAEIKDFLKNPNGNKEGWSHLVKCTVRDLCELDSAVWVKVFGLDQKMKQIFARDSGTFLKNPDKFGYIGNREDLILFSPLNGDNVPTANFDTTFEPNIDASARYAQANAEKAAYWQYGWENASFPIPFGKREIVYFMKNPRPDSIYGQSPVQIMADVILTLVYGSQYNLDFYQNSNMPEGIISMIGAPTNEVKAFKERLSNQQRETDPNTGFSRKVGFRMPVVNVDAKFIPFQAPAREMQILEQQSFFSKIVWMAFGLTADDLGFTENSNKAVSESMERRYAKTAVRPFLKLIEERINMEIIPEFDTTDLCFEFDFYDLDEDIKRHTLYESQIRMGIKTPEMIADEEHIDVVELKKQKAEADEQEIEKNNAMNVGLNESNIKALKLKEGVRVRCTTPIDGYSGKIGTIERKLADGSFQVRFDNLLIVLSAKELVIAGNDTEGVAKIKSKKDPFDDTLLEKELKSQIKEVSKKVKEALKLYQEGALKNVG